MISSLAPLLIAAVTYALTRNAMSLMFALLSPLVALASHIESRRHGKKEHAELRKEWQLASEHLRERISDREREERKRLEYLYPDTNQMIRLARTGSVRIWERQPSQPDSLRLRAGLGPLAAPWVVKPPTTGALDLVSMATLEAQKCSLLEHMPICLDLAIHNCVGIRFSSKWHDSDKDPRALEAVAAALILQAVTLLSPVDLVLTACLNPRVVSRWDWLKWLPHSQPSSILGVPNLATEESSMVGLADALATIISKRTVVGDGQRPREWPLILVLVDSGDSTISQRLLQLGRATSPQTGVAFIFVDLHGHEMSPGVNALVALTSLDTGILSYPGKGEHQKLTVETMTAGQCEMAARLLAPLRDPRGQGASNSLLPTAVGLTDLVGFRARDEPEFVIRNWNMRSRPLASAIGQSAMARVDIDLRVDGPHGLVAGTTGSGKSEFLQSLVASFATQHSPRRLNFLLVDYKGGAAFKDCRDLVHTVGLVTDLDGHLVGRVLTSLRAELHYRERLLASCNARDIIQMEKELPSQAPPNLLIIVDEFAALSREIPEFVEGMVDVAQRGRSLGIHMILATQRPAGVVTDNIRANTNLRIALRVSDASESNDVIGSPVAASFDRRIPGRGAIRIGPSELTTFQSAYVGGRSSPIKKVAAVMVRPFRMDASVSAYDAKPVSEAGQASDDSGPTDLVRFVSTVNAAARQLQILEPRKPWLPELPVAIDLETLLENPSEAGQLVIGLADSPRQQTQGPCSVYLNRIGNLLACGSSGSGKTYFLRTLAAAAGMQRGEEMHIYGLDCAGQGLRLLETLPHVGSVVAAADTEMTTRLLRMLRTTVDTRRDLLGQYAADDLVELRNRSSEMSGLPRVVVLLDGIHSFLESYDRLDGGVWIDELAQLLADGRAAGVHFVLSADRRGGIPMRFASQLPDPLILKLASPDEYLAAGIPPSALGASPPPGRAFYSGLEVQLATLAGAVTGSDQAKAFEILTRRLEASRKNSAPVLRKLSSEVWLGELPEGSMGISGIDLKPIAPPEWQVAGVFGPPHSGRTSALLSLATIAIGASPGRTALFISDTDRTPALPSWIVRRATGSEKGALILEEVMALMEERPDWDPLILIDDFNELLDPVFDSVLERLLRLGKTRDVSLFVAGESTAIRQSYSPVVSLIRKWKSGLLLMPDITTDGDIFGVTLPRASVKWTAGRGYLVYGADVTLIQTARSK